MTLAHRPTLRLGLALLVLLLAWGLRLYRLDAQSLWNDEALSAEMTRFGWSVIASKAALDVHPPLYYWALKVWASLMGLSEFGLRSLSVLWSTLVVALAYGLARKLLSGGGALLAMALVAVSPFQVYYAQETRMYAMLGALGLLALWLAAPSRPRGWLYRLAYAAALTLALYTQYFALLLPLVALAWLGWRRRPAIGPVAWLVDTGVALALFSPFALLALRFLGHSAPGPVRPPALAEALGILQTTLFGVRPPAQSEWLVVGAGILALVAPATAVLRGRPRPWFPLALWLVPLGGFLVVSATIRAVHPKVLIFAAVGWLLLVAAGLVQLQRLRYGPLVAVFGFVVLLGTSTVALRSYYLDSKAFRDDYRGVARWVESVRQPGDTLVMFPSGHTALFYYLPDEPGDAGIFERALPVPIPEQDARRILEQATAASPAVILVHLAPSWSDPQEVARRWLAMHTAPALEGHSGNLAYGLYAVPPPAGWRTLPLDVSFGPALDLRALAYPPERLRPGSALPLRFQWVARRSVEQPYTLFVHLIDGSGERVAQRDAWPANGYLPTSGWQPGRELNFFHGLYLPSSLPPGPYRLLVGLYDHQTGQRLPVSAGALADQEQAAVVVPVEIVR